MRMSDAEDAPLKLIDMGLACRFKNKKRINEVVGTVLTMAPEAPFQSLRQQKKWL